MFLFVKVRICRSSLIRVSEPFAPSVVLCGAVDTGLGAAMSSCAPNEPIPSTAACCAAAAVEPGRAIRRALEFGTPRNSKARASSVPALEVPFHEPYPEPKSALKMSQSPAGPLAAEKRVRVVEADDKERDKFAVPVSSGGGFPGSFGMLQMRAKALRLNEGRRTARRGASPRADPVARTACMERASSSAGAVPAAVLQSGTGFGCTDQAAGSSSVSASATAAVA